MKLRYRLYLVRDALARTAENARFWSRHWLGRAPRAAGSHEVRDQRRRRVLAVGALAAAMLSVATLVGIGGLSDDRRLLGALPPVAMPPTFNLGDADDGGDVAEARGKPDRRSGEDEPEADTKQPDEGEIAVRSSRSARERARQGRRRSDRRSSSRRRRAATRERSPRTPRRSGDRRTDRPAAASPSPPPASAPPAEEKREEPKPAPAPKPPRPPKSQRPERDDDEKARGRGSGDSDDDD